MNSLLQNLFSPLCIVICNLALLQAGEVEETESLQHKGADRTIKVYLEVNHLLTRQHKEIRDTGNIWPWNKEEVTVTKNHRLIHSASGSGWAIRLPKNNGIAIITAKHVIMGHSGWKNKLGENISTRNKTTKELKFNVYVGGYAIRPEKIGLIENSNDDIAFLLFAKEHENLLFENLKIFEISPAGVVTNQRVSCWGFPADQATQHRNEAHVSRVIPNSNRYVINSRLSPGFSGGLVADESAKKALGLISSVLMQGGDQSDQTNIISISHDIMNRIVWHESSRILKHEIQK